MSKRIRWILRTNSPPILKISCWCLNSSHWLTIGKICLKHIVGSGFLWVSAQKQPKLSCFEEQVFNIVSRHVETRLPLAINDITFYLIGPWLDDVRVPCSRGGRNKRVPEQTSAIQLSADNCSSLQLTSLETFAMLVVSLFILLAGAGISVSVWFI